MPIFEKKSSFSEGGQTFSGLIKSGKSKFQKKMPQDIISRQKICSFFHFLPPFKKKGG